ncbi:MAG: hypothetical protein M0R70_03655 [Nitrospirae bacterium]|nr:hypothetical protein [Nitrospirota bacterium]
MNRLKWQIILGIMLVAVSVALYIVQIYIFHASRDTFFYLFQDLAFIPIQVLLVTLILNQLLNVREKQSMLNKLNMVIGSFFSEVGTSLLKSFSAFDQNREKIRGELLVQGGWTDRQFAAATRRVRSNDYNIQYAESDLQALKTFLAGKRDFLLGLLENPNLLEHETFTELLWSVFHLSEELAVREDLRSLPPADGNHIAGDIKRAHTVLIVEWLAYMKHLKHDYPYLFSFAVRTNPFDPNASPEVK